MSPSIRLRVLATSRRAVRSRLKRSPCAVSRTRAHAELAEHRVHGNGSRQAMPSSRKFANIREQFSVLATAGYANGRKILEAPGKVPAEFRTDHDHEGTRTRKGSARCAALASAADPRSRIRSLRSGPSRAAHRRGHPRIARARPDRRPPESASRACSSPPTAESLRSCLTAYADEIRAGGDSTVVQRREQLAAHDNGPGRSAASAQAGRAPLDDRGSALAARRKFL